MDQLENSMADMKEINGPEFSVERDADDRNVLNVNIDSSTSFIFRWQPTTRDLALQSPLTGVYIYRYDPETETWRSAADGHAIYELFVREIMSVAKGYPML